MGGDGIEEEVSIRAPREGGDAALRMGTAPARSFNPRPP